MKNKKFTIHITLVHIGWITGLLIAVVCFIVFVVVHLAGQNSGRGALQEEDLKLKDIEVVWDLLHNEYLEKDALDDNALIEEALRGLVRSTADPYSVFLGAEETASFVDSLNSALEGIGVELTMHEGRVIIVTPLNSSPAEKAGILPQDIVVSVDGTDTSEMVLEEVVARIRGEQGTEVTLGIERKGRDDVLYITITRERITAPSVSFMLYDTVAYIRLSRFVNDTVQELERELAEIDMDSIDGIVLDLRNNPGGFLEGAVDVLGWFVVPDTVVVIEEDGDGEQIEYRTKGTGSLSTIPLVVLQNQGTGSASEIVLGALREVRSVPLVGEQSFGKGVVQKFLLLPGGTSVKYTAYRWFTPSHTIIHGHGIAPTIVVQDDPATEQDEQLERALQVVRKR
ncbi:MAG: S41 family peptidase [Candidatus Spechtbacteria bacterium SB0662_bin_43]|uniref:S41 family peptidase n=1 Tax=Candidatus Spechtbacteria bacterium SB0662_bin_43 TaxID=2604897 RepID=A0A845DBX3_9BACT|nr:S41 family peptidase [Candidatus Spechtbacteria bacterium SB0662_bin_43]